MYSFINEAFEYPYTYDPATARLRTHKITSAAVQPIKSAYTGAKWGTLTGGLAGGLALGATGKSKAGKIIKGTIGAVGGAIGGGAIGTSVGAASGTIKGTAKGVRAVTDTKKQLIDRDNAEQKKIMNSWGASKHQKLQAQARMMRNNQIDANLRNYKDAIARTPDAAERADVRRAYRAKGRHITDIHGANMQYT